MVNLDAGYIQNLPIFRTQVCQLLLNVLANLGYSLMYMLIFKTTNLLLRQLLFNKKMGCSLDILFSATP